LARLFGALGYRLRLDAQETAEDLADFLEDEAGRRHDRRLAGLCTARRRWY
jgi:hypothetical protein